MYVHIEWQDMMGMVLRQKERKKKQKNVNVNVGKLKKKG